jgi:hypothetical protein
MEPPRYQPLRALPERAYVPGQGPRPSLEVEDETRGSAAACLPADRWRQQAEYLWGVDLYNAGFFWEAHEVWEALWRASAHDPEQHSYLQGLIQTAAACLKGVTLNANAARSIGTRALERLDQLRSDRNEPYMGLDLVRFCTDFRAFIELDPTATERRPRIVLVM